MPLLIEKRLYWAGGGNLATKICAHPLRIRNDPDSTQVQPVGIPTRCDRCIIVMHALRVPDASVLKKFEVFVGQMERLPAMATGKLGASRAVPRIPTVVQTTTVVKQGEEPHDVYIRPRSRGEQQPIAFDAAPMIGSMQ